MSINFLRKGGGTKTYDATATADDIIRPKTAYVNGEKIEGTIQTKTIAQDVSLYNKPVTLTNQTLSDNKLYDTNIVDSILSVLTYSDGNLIMTLYNTESDELINEVSYIVSDNFSFSTVQDLTHCVVEKNADYIDYAVGIGYISDWKTYLNFKKIKYNLSTKTFELYNNIDYTVSNFSYNTVFKIEKAIDVSNRFYVLASNALGSWDTRNILITFDLTWNDTTSSIIRYDNAIADKNQTNGSIFELTGDGNWLRTYTSLIKLSENPENIELNNGINNVYFSHSMNYMLQDNNFYKIMSNDTYSNINNNKILITTISSYSNAFFSKDDKYLILQNDTTITVYSILDDNLAQTQTFTANAMKEVFNTFNFVTYNNTTHNIQLISAKEGEIFIEKITRNNIDYQYIYGNKTPSPNQVLKDKPFYTPAGIGYGTMSNNGELNYTPSTEEQTIPAGYTSGGKIEAVTNSIDSNIVAENIKKDVSILGVTGILKSGAMTEEEYNRCETVSNLILVGDTKIYRELEYIESTGSQYINTGIGENICCMLEFEFMPAELKSENQSYLSGTLDDFTFAAAGTENSVYLRYRTRQIFYQTNIDSSVKNTFSIMNNKITLNNKIMSSINTNDSVGANSNNILIFDNASLNRRARMRFYSLKLYDRNKNLLRDFIPVRNNKTGKAGLYDKVEDKFYGNSGTGDFIMGGVV